ncbi:MAG: lytic transglycosylase domain-containing protein [Prevotella sp.]|nr:lytic transglycosylase domain-containing protein [Prevotella sp.]
MEKLLKGVLLLVLSMMMMPLQAAEGKDADSSFSAFDWNPVIKAIIKVESNGNPNATSGASVGVLQITPVLVAECNNILRSRRSKKRFKLKDRFNVAKSIEMFKLIQSFHNPKNNIERAIRSWNGGMHYSVRRTQRYYEKVMRALRMG